MKTIKGKQLDHFPISDLQKVSDLIYFDGPFLSLFKNRDGDNYLYCWCDVDEARNRWLVFRISNRQLNSYLRKQTTLKDLLLNPSDGFLYSVDIDNDLNMHNVRIIEPKELPSDYVPDQDSYYEFTPVAVRTND